LDYVTSSDSLLEVARYLGFGAIAVSLVLLVLVGGLRARLLQRQKHDHSLAARWNPLLAECSEREPPELPPLGTGDVEAFLVLWCHAMGSMRGQAADNLRKVGLRLGLEVHAQRLVLSDKMQTMLVGLVTLGYLGTRDAIPLLLTQIREAPSLPSLIAARALLRVDAAIAMPHVLEGLASREDWSPGRIVPGFMECEPEQVGPVLAAAIGTELYKEQSGLRAGGLARLLRLHVATHPALLRDAVLDVLVRAEGVSALVAALAALMHPEDVEHARRLLGHEHWPVRVAAARTLGRLGGAEDFDRLCQALRDKHWWVRYRSAQALCALPGADVAKLQALTQRLTDRFAVDILRQVLAERAAA